MTRTKLRSRLVAKERERAAKLCDAVSEIWRRRANEWGAQEGPFAATACDRSHARAATAERLARQIREGIEP